MSARDDLVALEVLRKGAETTAGLNLTMGECKALLAILDTEPVAWMVNGQYTGGPEATFFYYAPNGKKYADAHAAQGDVVTALYARPEASDADKDD